MRSSCISLLLAFALAGSANSDNVETRRLRQRGATLGAAHMTPADLPMTSLLAASSSVAAPAAKAQEAPAVQVQGNQRLNAVVARLRKTSAYLAVQKTLQRHYFGSKQEPSEGPDILVVFEYGTAEQMALIITCLIWMAVASLIAFFYKSKYEVPARDEAVKLDVEEFKQFKHGLFAFVEVPETCLLSMFCPGMRWARSLSLVVAPDGNRLIGFWAAFFIFIGIDFVADISGEVFVYMAAACILCVYRQQMRRAFEMTGQGGVTYVEDCLSYFFCMCCTVTQDARQVEDAFKAGHTCVKEDKMVEA